MSRSRRFFRTVTNYAIKKKRLGIANYDVTSKCNLNCEHFYLKKTKNPKKDLTDKEWEKIFLEQKKKGITMVHLTGGEPALRPNVIKAADRIFDFVAVVSNGTVKIPEDIQRRIFVSIDGPKEIHNKIRGGDFFDKILKNIKDDKRVILTPTLTTTNHRYIDDMIKIARDSNVDGITFSTYTSHNAKNDPLLLKGKELDWTIQKLKAALKNNRDILFLTPYTIGLLKSKKYRNTCPFKKDVIAFDARMKVKRPCPLGAGVDCTTCGCIVPLITYALVHADVKTWFLFDRLFPERYVKSR